MRFGSVFLRIKMFLTQFMQEKKNEIFETHFIKKIKGNFRGSFYLRINQGKFFEA